MHKIKLINTTNLNIEFYHLILSCLLHFNKITAEII